MTHTDDHRPADLPANVPEPRCGDLVAFRHLDDGGLFKVRTTSRYRDSTNSYSFDEVDGDRVINLREGELVALWDTDKSALWPVVYCEADLMHRRRDTEHGGLTYHGEVVDAAKRRAEADRQGGEER